MVIEPTVAAVSIVTIVDAAPDEASKITLLVASGALPAPGVPPELVAQ